MKVRKPRIVYNNKGNIERIDFFHFEKEVLNKNKKKNIIDLIWLIFILIIFIFIDFLVLQFFI